MRVPADLPVAGIPVYKGEMLTLNKGKIRPGLILATPGTLIEREFRENFPRRHYARTYLVAPFYTAESTGTQAGYPAEFILRVKLCEYTQFFWDKLPLTQDHPGSFLRFDQIQAVEPDIHSLRPAGYKLSEEGAEVLQEMLARHMHQVDLDPDGLAFAALSALKERPPVI